MLITTNLIFPIRDKGMNARLQLLVLQRGNLDIITLAKSVIQDRFNGKSYECTKPGCPCTQYEYK